MYLSPTASPLVDPNCLPNKSHTRRYLWVFHICPETTSPATDLTTPHSHAEATPMTCCVSSCGPPQRCSFSQDTLPFTGQQTPPPASLGLRRKSCLTPHPSSSGGPAGCPLHLPCSPLLLALISPMLVSCSSRLTRQLWVERNLCHSLAQRLAQNRNSEHPRELMNDKPHHLASSVPTEPSSCRFIKETLPPPSLHPLGHSTPIYSALITCQP